MGRKLVTAMKEKLGKQLFEVVIQASANGDIVARETIKVCCLELSGCAWWLGSPRPVYCAQHDAMLGSCPGIHLLMRRGKHHLCCLVAGRLP